MAEADEYWQSWKQDWEDHYEAAEERQDREAQPSRRMARNSHVCGTGGIAFTWGEGSYGASHSEPVTSELPSGVVSIIDGHVQDGRVVAAMKSDGNALMWGGQAARTS